LCFPTLLSSGVSRDRHSFPTRRSSDLSATNLRLREVVLGYNLSSNILGENSVIKGARISLVGRNLFFLYKDAPFDPEVVTGTGKDRRSTRLNSSHVKTSYAVFCLKKKI